MASLRYTRQTRLADVGPSGQARLEGLRVPVAGDDLAARVEALYLAGAGVATVVEAEGIAEAARGINSGVGVEVAGVSAGSSTSTSTGTSSSAEVVGVLRAGAVEVAEGALRALFAVRRGLFDGEAAR